MPARYDDDRLVQLLTEGSLSCARIAEKLGISAEMVRRIDRGQARPDLQERINDVLREQLRATRHRRVGAAGEMNPSAEPAKPSASQSPTSQDRSATPQGRAAAAEAPLPSHRKKDYDEERLIQGIAAGRSAAAIACEVGLSADYVRRIASGRARPDLGRLITQRTADHRRETRRLLAHSLKALVVAQLKEAINGEGPEARRAREFLINKAMPITSIDTAFPDIESPNFQDLDQAVSALAGLAEPAGTDGPIGPTGLADADPTTAKKRRIPPPTAARER